MSLEDNARHLLERYGEAYTLKRTTSYVEDNSWTKATEDAVYHEQIGKRRVSEPNDAGGGLARDAQSVFILHPDYTEPVKGDRVAPGAITADDDADVHWHEIVHVDHVRVKGVLSKYYVYVRN